MRVTVLILGILASLAMPTAVQAQTPVSTPAPTLTPDCYELRGYRNMFIRIYRDLPDEHIEAIKLADEKDIETMRPSQLLATSAALDEYATLLDQIPRDDIPDMVQPLHDAFVDLYSLKANIYRELGTSGMFTAMMYMDALTDVQDAINAADAAGRQQCGKAWDSGLLELTDYADDEP